MFKPAALLMVTLAAISAAAQSTPKTILVHAHRGGRAYRPENTLASFKYGISVGADVLELDLAVTKDNVLVVSHSPFLIQPAADSSDPRIATVVANERKCIGPPLPPGTYIHSLTLAQIKQYDCGSTTLPAFPHQVAVPHTTIPTFDEVLDLAPATPSSSTSRPRSSPPAPRSRPPPKSSSP